MCIRDRADTDTFPTVDAPVGQDLCLAVPHPDCLGRAALDAVDAAVAQVPIQGHRMEKLAHDTASSCGWVNTVIELSLIHIYAAVRYRGRNRKTTFGENGKEKAVSTGIASIGLGPHNPDPQPCGMRNSLRGSTPEYPY